MGDVMEDNTYLILPGCDDTNRGDQALIWETVEIAKEAGFDGNFYMIAESEKSTQSLKEGIKNIEYILRHPSTHFKQKNNINYGILLKLKWAFVSLFDSLSACLLLSPFVRKYFLFLYSKSVRQSIEKFEKAKAAFVKGGGFIHAYGSPIETYVVFFQLYHIMLAQSMGIPVYVMPNSFGPFDSVGSATMVKKVLNKCKLVYSRENISSTKLNEIGVKNETLPDLAFYLRADNCLSDQQRKKFDSIPFKTKKCVALTMRPYRFPSSSNPEEDYLNYKNSLCGFIKYLSNNGYYPVMIEHTFSDTEHEKDMSCITDVAEMLGNSCEYGIYSDLSLDSRQLKYVYSNFECIVGTRFHSVIFSIASGVPAIAITYGGNKGQGIMKDMNLDEYALPINELSTEILIKKFNKLNENIELVRSNINEYIGHLNDKKIYLIEQLRG